MSNQNQFYTYVYLDPRKSGDFIYQRGIDEVYCFNHEPFYIGKGRDSRLYYHLKCYEADKNLHKKNTIRKIQKAELEPIIIKVLQNVNEDEAFSEEISLISIVGRADKGLGSLTNMTDGGESGKGREREDISGQKFGKLTVLKFAYRIKDRNSWLCSCDCGNEKIISIRNLKNGDTTTCGCLQQNRTELRRVCSTTHGKTNTSEYYSWRNIRKICLDKNYKQYKDYGALGITICDRWTKFENFLEDMGERPSSNHVLSRLNKTNNFEPSNCKWITRTEQSKYRKDKTF